MHQPEIQLTIGSEGDAERRTTRGGGPGGSSLGKIFKSKAWEMRFPEF